MWARSCARLPSRLHGGGLSLGDFGLGGLVYARVARGLGVWIGGRVVDGLGFTALFVTAGPATLALALVFARRLRHRSRIVSSPAAAAGQL